MYAVNTEVTAENTFTTQNAKFHYCLLGNGLNQSRLVIHFYEFSSFGESVFHSMPIRKR